MRLKKLEFKNVDLGNCGLVRIIDAANKTQSLEKLDVGVLTDDALILLAGRLTGNKYLEELLFSETNDHQKYWSGAGMNDFCQMLKSCKNLKKVKVTFQDCNYKKHESQEFLENIEFYND